MVQKERSRDYKEEFSESESDDADLYLEDSDEEWNAFKREINNLKLKKTQKLDVLASTFEH